jgi:hypothetical protein
MSSPGHGHKYSVPPPRSESPAQGQSGHDNNNVLGSPRDHSGPSSSRHTSQSSSIHQQQYARSNQDSQPHGQSHAWKAGDANGSQQQVRLPRITTVNVDAGTSGPMSAPLQPQPRNLLPTGSSAANGPLRSSTSPDPRHNHSPRASPSNSPIENRPNPVLGPSSRGPSPAGSSRSPIPSISVSPRKSSHMDGGMSSHSSQHSLGDQDNYTPTNVTPLTFPVPQTRTSRRGEPTYCGQCGQVVHGQFVRAMGHVYHLNCFRCKVGPFTLTLCSRANEQDCNKVVAQKFFPVEEGENMYPLCETDYFARLDLICAQCKQALRSSYITACGE